MYLRILKFNSLGATTPSPVNPGERTAIGGWVFVNTNAAIRYVKLYFGNSQSFSSSGDVPTVGTDAPKVTIQVPASGKAEMFISRPFVGSGTCFYAVTTGAADTDTTAGTAGDIIGSIFYE